MNELKAIPKATQEGIDNGWTVDFWFLGRLQKTLESTRLRTAELEAIEEVILLLGELGYVRIEQKDNTAKDIPHLDNSIQQCQTCGRPVHLSQLFIWTDPGLNRVYYVCSQCLEKFENKKSHSGEDSHAIQI